MTRSTWPTGDGNGRLAKESRRLNALADELRRSPRSIDPAVWAAGEALELAAVLLRTIHTGAAADLRSDALGLARSTVEAIKYALRDVPRPEHHRSLRPGGNAR